jgi:hypothetical protein
LFAAFSIADGAVISELHRRHRATEFRKFLAAIDKAVPAGLDVHPGPGWPADEILNSLADYLAKLEPGSPADRQDNK